MLKQLIEKTIHATQARTGSNHGTHLVGHAALRSVEHRARERAQSHIRCTRTNRMQIHTCAQTCTYMHIYMLRITCKCTYIYTCTCTCTRASMQMHTCRFTCTYLHKHKHNTCACTHMHMHAHLAGHVAVERGEHACASHTRATRNRWRRACARACACACACARKPNVCMEYVRLCVCMCACAKKPNAGVRAYTAHVYWHGHAQAR